MRCDLDEIRDTGLTIEEYFTMLNLYLESIEKEPVNFSGATDEVLAALESKAYCKIISKDGQRIVTLRVIGRELIESIMDFTPKATKPKKGATNKLFDEFWELFPSTDAHSIYAKSRILKSNKKGCRDKYKTLIEKEKVKHSDIIKALRYEIEDRKKTSGAKNKLSFMKNSSTWLTQREFEVILEVMDTTKDDDGDWTSSTI